MGEAGLGSLIAQSFGSLASMASAQENYRNAMSMLEFQNQWNSPLEQLKRAKAAGLNPNAVNQTIAGSEGFGSMAAADAASLPNAMPDLGAQIGNSVNSALNAEFVKANTEKTKEETRGQEIENEYNDATFDVRVKEAQDRGAITEAEAKNAKYLAEKYPEMIDLSLEEQRAEIDKKKAEKTKIDKEVDKIDQEIKESNKRIDKLEQDIKTAKSQEALNYAQVALTEEKKKNQQLLNDKQEMENRREELTGSATGITATYFDIESKDGTEAADKWLEESNKVMGKVIENSSKASAKGHNEAYDETVEGTEKRQLEKEMNDKVAEIQAKIDKLTPPQDSYQENSIKNYKKQIENIRTDYSKRIAEVDKGHKNSYGVNLAGYGINFTN